jgi:hypothetical protein
MLRIILVFFIFIGGLRGQNKGLIGGNTINQKILLASVKQLSQFFNRFNNLEDLPTGKLKPDSVINSERRSIVDFENRRKAILGALFNQKDTAKCPIPLVADFIEYVAKDSNKVHMSYFDNDWFASVKCRMVLCDKPFAIEIVLKPSGNPKEGYRWLIISMKDVVKDKKNFIDSTKFISPQNHEIGFMDLFDVFKDSRNILNYSRQKSIDVSSAILYMVENDLLKYEGVESICYHFLQVDGWAFTVEDFNRFDKNSGWLISSLSRMGSDAKMLYIRRLIGE